jgi:ribosomal protein S18 acetylase RimI-like enzyme
MRSRIGVAKTSMSPVEDIYSAETMRGIRNQVRQFMTHNTEEIDMDEQIKWFLGTYTPEHVARRFDAFVMNLGRTSIGYGIVRQQDERFWVTGAVLEDYRGYGYGQELFTWLTNHALFDLNADEVYLDVRADNRRAQTLYAKLGYRVIGSEGDAIVMRYGFEAPDAA